MASRRGKIITVIILVAITGISFVFWTIPQENESTFIVTNYENYLDGIKNIHEILQESINIEFQNLRDEKITPEEYISVAEITTSQVTAKISEFVTSKPSEQWQESYISYMEALKKFNSYVLETKVYANLLKEQKDVTDTLQKIEELKKEYQELVKRSDELRP